MPNIEDLKKKVAAKRPKTPIEKMKVRRGEMMPITAGELKTAIEANPSHPNAEAFALGIGLGTDEQMPAGTPLTVEKADLQALLDNAEIEITETVEDGITYVDKTIKKTPPPPKPAKPES